MNSLYYTIDHGKRTRKRTRKGYQTIFRRLKATSASFGREVDHLIRSNESDTNTVALCLDTLLSLTMHGISDDLFFKLLEYYRTLDEEGADFYLGEYRKQGEEEE